MILHNITLKWQNDAVHKFIHLVAIENRLEKHFFKEGQNEPFRVGAY